MRLEVDRSRCEGHGLCAGAAPSLLDLDDDGEPAFLRDEGADSDAEQARAAVRVCPVAALRLV
ncbi:ferredoxin [Nocardia sp. CA2R105]|uniref:ferredoxin n=1 Tax=Nocardia coffeae TaxID=2873381 RepID=UPI001CA6DC0F|nr:ferredoxin [Nocardia coffeae]MBY8861907.1 ferredoxin [Nocardia coffeae]